jgi:hypothetical protein
MVKSKSPKATALLGLIQTPTEPSTIEAAAAEPKPAPIKSAPVRKPVAKVGGKGKRVTIFLHEGDRRIIRELMAYLAGQGRRVSESIAIKAALRMAKPGGALLDAHEEAASQDLRFKHIA